MDDDEAALAYAACRDLRALYEAYRATSRAHLLVLRRVDAGAAFSDRPRTADERLRQQLALAERAALAGETEAVFARRSQQLRDRMLELSGLRVP
jgi:hypothetical protein